MKKRKGAEVETFILLMLSIYNIWMALVVARLQWKNAIVFVVSVGVILCWVMAATKYRTYQLRVTIYALTTLISFVFVCMYVSDLFAMFPYFITVMIIIGLFGIENVLGFGFLGITFLLIYHFFMKKTIHLEDDYAIVNGILQIINVYFALIAVFMWIQKRKESQETLSKTIEHLNTAERSKDDFIANVSHEIRTPINTVCGLSDMILSQNPGLSTEMKSDIMSINSAGRELTAVVSDILDFSELQAEKITLEEEVYDIGSTINDVVNMALARKGKKNIRLLVDVKADIPCKLWGDEKKIRRVIMNFMDNALKFTESGCILLRISSRNEEYGVNLICSVTDTGIGMKEEELERLFSTFNQANTGSNRHETGIGLGLAISQLLLQKMGGIITVKSKHENGSKFKFVLSQKVVDATPFVHVKNREALNIAFYMNQEKYSSSVVREWVTDLATRIVEGIHVKNKFCKNLAELKRVTAKERFTHVFLSIQEYREDQAYFDSLCDWTYVVVIMDRGEEIHITNPKIRCFFRPVYLLPIVNLLNGEDDTFQNMHIHENHFVAPGVKVLVVDDNEMNLHVIRGMLKRYMIQMDQAISGVEAIEKIQSAEYDFVFMDHMMPEMDGVETLNHIRQMAGKYFKEVPIIALTANSVAGSREMFLREGFNDFLEKPVDSSVLERVLLRAIPTNKQLLNHTETPAGKEISVKKETIVAGGQQLSSVSLNLSRGYVYCGGEENYYEILKIYMGQYRHNMEELQQSYTAEDIKNYTIRVHGVKSFMYSIGADEVGDMAKALEAAGKENDVAYIKQKHEALCEKWKQLIPELEALLAEQGIEIPQDKAKSQTVFPEIDKVFFEERLKLFEDAMYVQDGNGLNDILDELVLYSYEGVNLEEKLPEIRRKVELSDYMSAYVALQQLKEQLQRETAGGEENG